MLTKQPVAEFNQHRRNNYY